MTGLEALALGQLGSLIGSGLPAAEALEAVAGRLPEGRVGKGLMAAARAVGDGVDTAEALARSLPDLEPLLAGAANDLPRRLALLGEHRLRMHRLGRRLLSVAAYPVWVSAGVLLVCAAVALAVHMQPDYLNTSAQLTRRLVFVTLLPAASILICLLTLRSFRSGQPPLWKKLLPGSELWQLTSRARFMTTYAACRDPDLGGLDPMKALHAATAAATGDGKSLQIRHSPDGPGNLSMKPLLQLGLTPAEAMALILGERAGRPVRTALEEAARLEREAALAADRLVRWSGTLLLMVAAVGVALLILGVYYPLFEMTRAFLPVGASL